MADTIMLHSPLVADRIISCSDQRRRVVILFGVEIRDHDGDFANYGYPLKFDGYRAAF